MLQLFEKMTPEKIEAARKEVEEAAMKATTDKSKTMVESNSSLVMQGDMRSML